MTLSIMTLSVTTFSTMGLFATLSTNDTQHDDTKRNNFQHNGLICDTQHNDTQHNDIQYSGLACDTKHK